MLTSLRIENFAIVSTLELDFKHGMSAFTGETGAGKSIMIDALMLVLGERADASVVRKGTEKCDISAHFHIHDAEEPILWLRAHDIDHDSDISLRRIITREGRSKAYINGYALPLQKIKEFSEMLVHIHGQHEHQTLLQHTTHRKHLDEYANHHALLAKVTHLYQQCQRIQQALQALQQPSQSKDQILLLQYQIDELTNLAPQADEMSSLHEEHQQLQHAYDYLQHIEHIKTLINGDESPNVIQQLHKACHESQVLPQNNLHIQNIQELFNHALIQCEEAFDEITQFASHIHVDEDRLQLVEARMSALHQAARKYHVDVNQLANHLSHLQTELHRIESSQSDNIMLQQQYEALCQQYQQTALQLRESRQHHAQKLSDDITRIIQQLGMPKGYVSIAFSQQDHMQAHGLDKIEYQVCTNPGMPLQALSKVASGGELSRISLAIQMIAAQRASTPTLLFDEVDVGIGGATAALVGQLLRNLGERLQVFCVTHQPQVAAHAHHHFMVEKHTIDEQTFSCISALNKSQQIDEIARMLGGLVITEQTLSHAKELLAQSALGAPTSLHKTVVV